MPGEGYNTRQKRLVLGALIDCSARAVTADELYEVLRARGQAIGKTTVYRRLSQLAETGEARRVQSPGGALLYQYVGDARTCAGHLHCQCTVCGRLMHVDCACLGDLKTHLMKAHGFALDAGRTALLGRCLDCGEDGSYGAADAQSRDAGV